MHLQERDLTAAARIRNTALRLFAANGVESTSIRQVAAAAKVSPGLVQHHFRTKDDLRRAVDAYVVETMAVAFADLRAGDADADLVSAVADRIADIMREQKLALLYVARTAQEGGKAGSALFGRVMAVADATIAQLAERGLTEPDADLQWIALNAVILRLGTALFEPAISRHLGRDFSSPEELDRWNRATTFLFRSGAFRRPKYSDHDKPLRARTRPPRRP